MPIISRQSLRRLEAYFIAPHIYQRPDVSDRQAKLATIVSTNIIPRLLRLHSEIITDAPPVKVLVEALAPSKADISGFDDVLLGADLEYAFGEDPVGSARDLQGVRQSVHVFRSSMSSSRWSMPSRVKPVMIQSLLP